MNHNGADPRMVGGRFFFQLSGSSQLSLRYDCLCRLLTNVNTSSLSLSLSLSPTHTINVATLPSLTFTAMQSKDNFQPAFHTRLSLPFSHSFIHPFFLPSVLFCRPLCRSHSFAHDPILSRPGWLPLRGGSRARALLLEQLLVELKRVPVKPPLLPPEPPHLSSSLHPLRHSLFFLASLFRKRGS